MFLTPDAKSLHFAARPPLVAKHAGLLLLPLSILFAVALAVCALDGRADVTARTALVTGVLALGGWRLGRIRCATDLQTNEALVVTALVFGASALALAVPFAAYGIAPVDAVFEAMSAVTTTGLTTLATVEDKPAGFLFARAWMQWVGGLGVMVLALAMVIRPGVSARRLGFDAREVDDLAGGTRAQARDVLGVYALLTLASFLLLWVAGAGAFDALAHALAGISTGGFSTHDTSLAGMPHRRLGPAVAVIAFAGALPMAWYRGALRRPRGLPRRTRWALPLLLLLGAALFVPFVAIERGWRASLGHGLVMVVSAGTTAGFSNLSVADLPAPAKLVLIGVMSIGGEIGSTSGGLKVLRVLVLLALLRGLLQRASLARASRIPLRAGGSRIGPQELESIVAVVLAYAALVGVSWLVFLAFGYRPLDSLFEVVSATGTVGLSTGITRPGLETALKGVLCLDMLAGRVEVVAILLLAFPPTWIGRRRPWR